MSESEQLKVTVHDILDHLVSVAPLDEATRILFHHAIADDASAQGVDSSRARIDPGTGSPVVATTTDNSAEIAAVQSENAALKARLDAMEARLSAQPAPVAPTPVAEEPAATTQTTTEEQTY